MATVCPDSCRGQPERPDLRYSRPQPMPNHHRPLTSRRSRNEFSAAARVATGGRRLSSNLGSARSVTRSPYGFLIAASPQCAWAPRMINTARNLLNSGGRYAEPVPGGTTGAPQTAPTSHPHADSREVARGRQAAPKVFRVTTSAGPALRGAGAGRVCCPGPAIASASFDPSARLAPRLTQPVP